MATAAHLIDEPARGEHASSAREDAPPPTVLFGGQVVEELDPMQAARLRTMRALDAASRVPFPLDRNTLGAVPVPLSRVLERWRRGPLGGGLLASISAPLERALGAILADPRAVIARTHAMLPPHKVREMDTRSLQKLARLPGYTVRQKLASTRHVRAPIRYKSCDTTENKVVKQLAIECVRAITNGNRRHLEHPDIERLSRRCEEILAAGSPFSELTPDVTPRPNNTLLSDQNYGFVWRCFRAIRDVPGYWEAAWGAHLALTTEALAMAIMSDIAAREHVWFEDRMTRWSAADSARLHTWGGERLDEVELFVLDDIPRRISVRVDHGAATIELETSIFTEHRLNDSTSIRLRLEPGESAARIEEGRGSVFDVNVYGGEGGELIDLLSLVADCEGVADLATRLCEDHIELPPVREGQRSHCVEGRGNLIGIDFIGPVAILAGSDVADVVPMATAVDDHHLAATMKPEPLGAHGVREVWRCLSGEVEETPREVLRAAFREHIPDTARIATAIPDHLDEVASSALRRMLPPARDAWLVWRSVAAALVESARDDHGFEEGDVLLVLDLDVQPPTLTILTARCDEHVEQGGKDGFYWERRPPIRFDDVGDVRFDIWSAHERVARQFFQDIEDEDHRRFLQEKLIDEGHTERARPAHLLSRDASGWEHHAVDVSADSVWANVEARIERDAHAWLEEGGRGAEAGRALDARLEANGGGAKCHLLVASQRGIVPDTKTFGRDFASIRSVCATDIARGCERFLERHTNKLPTFRDMLPSITLQVGKAAIPLLDPEVLKQGVQPSQSLRFTPQQAFKLPKGVENVEMPLRTGEGRDREEFSAFITNPSFPLRRDVEVRIETRYRYVQDAFIVALLPIDRASAPFDRLEIEWRRSEGEGTQELTVNNEPPEFAAGGVLDEEDVETFLASEAAQRVIQLVGELQDSAQVHRRINNDEAGVSRDLKDLERLLKAVGVGLRKLVVPGQTGSLPGTSGLEESLLDAADIPEPPRKRRRKKKSKSDYNRTGLKALSKKIDKKRQTRLVSELEAVRDEAAWALASMRHHAPARLQPTLLSEEYTDRHYHALGRMMRRGEGDHREDFDAFFAQLIETAEMKPDANLQHRLWCLATHLWSREEALFDLKLEQVNALADFVNKVASELEERWHEERISGELFREIGVIALALLRERGKGREARFDANSEWCSTLAESCVEITNKLEQSGFDKPPRIALGDQDRSFIQILTESLRGHSVARIQLSDTDGE